MARSDPDRLFVREGFRHYRRTYSRAEARWGLVVFGGLAALVAWVVWRGANPREDLTGAVPIGGTVQAARPAGDRGPLPMLAGQGWREGEVSQFSANDLYVKINGRADFFLSKGFQSLTFVGLENDAGQSIDLELYDMGSLANAVGAFTAERPEGADLVEAGAAQHYGSRNAVFLASGRYYARVIGSDESAPVKAQLEVVRTALASGLGAGERPWAYLLLVDALGKPANDVSYVKERAFSIEAAREVWVAREGDVELFVVATADAGAAATAVTTFIDGFASYGERIDSPAGPAWVKDEFIGTLATARAVDTFVIGIRGAPEREPAEAELTRLEAAVRELPADVRARATAPAPTLDEAQGAGDGEEAY
ncbi:MAG TPA: DUF6599 family protein [Kofleriaceae bacterium]|nr:DUF6599 family protein [Kofleriaceae bacterium]